MPCLHSFGATLDSVGALDATKTELPDLKRRDRAVFRCSTFHGSRRFYEIGRVFRFCCLPVPETGGALHNDTGNGIWEIRDQQRAAQRARLRSIVKQAWEDWDDVWPRYLILAGRYCRTEQPSSEFGRLREYGRDRNTRIRFLEHFAQQISQRPGGQICLS